MRDCRPSYHASLCRLWLLLGAMFAAAFNSAGDAAPTPLLTLQYRIVGSVLEVSPAALSVPKGIAGSVATAFQGSPDLTNGAYVVASLRGPSLAPKEVVGAPGLPLLLPPLSVVGDYVLEGIQLVRDQGGVRTPILDASPGSVPVHVFDQVLVAQVTSRPLTTEEIADRGIAIDQTNFRVTEFQVGLVLDGRQIPITLPVVAPRAVQSTEIIPAAELTARLQQADQANRDLSAALKLPPSVQSSGIEVRGINFQVTEDTDADLALKVPSIPALLLIPGNIGFLNQFFSVQAFVEDAAPDGSGLSVRNVQATLDLPPGPDGMPAADPDHPGDDPLRFARIGPNRVIQNTLPVVMPGPDGKAGTTDDILRLGPGQTGQAEFLIEGLQEGLQTMTLNLTAELEGLAGGIVKITGKGAGSVLVRNPRFSLAFTHPKTVRFGEPYDAQVTILNTGSSPANLVTITLPPAAVSGAVLESDATVPLGTILPGETATADFRLRPQRTGAVTFSDLTTGDDSIAGHFQLRMGVDERDVELSPDTLALPDDAALLPQAVLDAAQRVLGQALSAATAPLLPAGVLKTGRQSVVDHALNLAEAGQRLRYGDATNRVLLDLLLDWQGGGTFDAGFDQILRQTDAGRAWRDAILGTLVAADGSGLNTVLANLASDLAGRGEAWLLASAESPAGVGHADGTLLNGTNSAAGVAALDALKSAAPRALIYRAPQGFVLVTPLPASGTANFCLTNGSPKVGVALLTVTTNGAGRQLNWDVAGPLAAGTCLGLDFSNSHGLTVSAADGTAPQVLAPSGDRVIHELPPRIVGAIQDLTVNTGRPPRTCGGPEAIANYGTVVGVLFSKPMTSADVNQPPAYALDNGDAANSVQIQAGNRLALLNLGSAISAIRARRLTAAGISDPRGGLVGTNAVDVRCELGGAPFRMGTALNGRVLHGDGSPAANVPVTLTYTDFSAGGLSCSSWVFRPCQVLTDTQGTFTFDFILAGIPYAVSATEISGLSAEALRVLLEGGSDAAGIGARLSELSTKNQATLLAALATGTLAEAITQAEALDRAVFRDLIPLDGPGRQAGTNIVVLRFRGRGAVTGMVLDPDGKTPRANVAVNLFPDPDSREQVRGVLSDTSGRFAFFGVPLGAYSVQADDGAGNTRALSDVLDVPGEAQDLTIVLSHAVVPRTALAGRVTEDDVTRPHSGAQVFVGKFGQANDQLESIVATATANSDGFWLAGNVPEGSWDLVALSVDGLRKAVRRGVPATAGVTNQITLSLGGLGRVTGIVRTPSGVPVTNALVAGGISLVRTDGTGRFNINDIPTGVRSLAAGVTPGDNPDIRFTRQGRVQLNVLPGVLNVADLILDPAGVVQGFVRDELGRPVPGGQVAHPVQGGFEWTPVDSNGFYRFEGLKPGSHTFSAPSPPVGVTDLAAAQATLASTDASADQIQAAIGQALATFVGANDPLLNGQGAAFAPGHWGYVQTDIDADGVVVNQDIRFFRLGTVAGIVLNGQSVPIGAKIRLTGLRPQPNGGPGQAVLGDLNSDPATGAFAFTGAVFYGDAVGREPSGNIPGPYLLQATSPLIPTVITHTGFLSEVASSDTNLVLSFPPPQSLDGRIAGSVFNPDGSPAAAGVKILIPFDGGFGSDIARGFQAGDIANPVTQAVGASNGPVFALPPFFPPTAAIPAIDANGNPGRSYPVVAEDPVTGFFGRADVTVFPGQTNSVRIRLQGTGGARLRVVFTDGSPAPSADVALLASAFPQGGASGRTDANGNASFANLVENIYAVAVSVPVGAGLLQGRGAVAVPLGGIGEVTIVLQPSASITGRFLATDRVTPVVGAQVQIGGIGFAATDPNGVFLVSGVPLGTYAVSARDPVSGRTASATVQLGINGRTNSVLLVEATLGQIHGSVLNSARNGFVSAATVGVTYADPLTPARTTTTDPAGAFSFPGSPPGDFQLTATDPVSGVQGHASGTLPAGQSSLQQDVALDARANVTIHVRDSAGAPASNAVVVLTAAGLAEQLNADATGSARFSGLTLGGASFLARDGQRSGSRSVATTNLVLAASGEAPDVTLVLSGTGTVTGHAFESDGTTPVGGGTVVRLEVLSDPLRGDAEFAATDGQGAFAFDNVAVGESRLTLQSGGLAASAQIVVISNGVAFTQDLTLSPSGSVVGRVLRAEGSPAVATDVVLTFGNRGGSTDRALFTTAADGRFRFDQIPLGNDLALSVHATQFDGIAFARLTLSVNGQTNDVGDLTMDEAPPVLVSSTPASGSASVSVTTSIELLFSEALDPASLAGGGILLRQGVTNIPFAIRLLPPPGETAARLIRLQPVERLHSLTRYDVLIVPRLDDPVHGIALTGPTDLVGRSLVASVSFNFTTADNDPPLLLSSAPVDGEEQVDLRAVPRLAFNKALQPGVIASLTGPSGPVSGRTDLVFGNQAVTFTPDAALSANALYTLTVAQVVDTAGNAASGQPFVVRFRTLDTIGPELAALRIAGGVAPIAGRRIRLEALPQAPEAGMRVRFFLFPDLGNVLGTITALPFELPFTLPARGSAVIGAFALDRFGNPGSNQTITINVVSNQPPTPSLALVSLTNAAIIRDDPFTLHISAADDVSVTNLQLTVTGAMNFTTNFPDGIARDLSLVVADPFATNGTLQFALTATDFAGLTATATLAAPFRITSRTHGPDLVSLGIVGGLAPIAGRPVQIEAVPGTNDPGLSVLFFTPPDVTQVVAVVTNPPFVIHTNLPADGVFTLGAHTQDRFGLAGSNVLLSATILSNQPPVPAIALVAPTGAPPVRGQTFILQASASDDVAVTNLALVGSGILTLTTNFSDGETKRLVLTIPTDAPTNGAAVFALTATDFAGLVGSVSLTVPFREADRPPFLSLLTNLEAVERSWPIVFVEAGDTDSNLVRVTVTSDQPVAWADSGTAVLDFAAADHRRAALRLGPLLPVTSVVEVIAFDTDGLSATNHFAVTGLRDANNDGIPDRDQQGGGGGGNAIGFDIPGTILLVEGTATNISIPVFSTNAPLAWIDYDATNLPPAFVTVADRHWINSPSNGAGTLVLAFSPLSDAAGDYDFALRAETTRGGAATARIRITVLDNPALLATHWKEPVDGNWSDPARWSDGVPSADHDAMIDAAGTYTVILDTPPIGHGFVVASHGATLNVRHASAFDAPLEIRDGLVLVEGGQSWTFNNIVANRGRVGLGSGDFRATVRSDRSGRLESLGLFEVRADGPGRADALIQVPVTVPAPGVFRLLPEAHALVDLPGCNAASFSLAGTLEVQTGARLAFDGCGNTVTFARGAQLPGNGRLAFGSDTLLVTGGDSDGDGWWDGVEIVAGTDPHDAHSFPQVDALAAPAVSLSLLARTGGGVDRTQLAQPEAFVILPTGAQGGSDPTVVAQPYLEVSLPTLSSPAGIDGQIPANPAVEISLPSGTILPDPNALVLASPLVLLQLAVPTPPPGPNNEATPIVLRNIRIAALPANRPALAGTGATPTFSMVLDWDGPPAGRYAVETSSDLARWTEVPITVGGSSAGRFRGQGLLPPGNAAFFRIRLLP